MTTRWMMVSLGALLAAASSSGCGSDKSNAAAGTGGRGTGGTVGGGSGGVGQAGNDGGAFDGATTLYQRLGGETGIRTVMTNFVVNRVLKDAKINGYFLNSTVDGGNVIRCLTLQVGALTGGPEQYPSAGCRDMKSSHQGLKISMLDFGDLAAHLVDELKVGGVAQTDIDTIVSALLPMADDIVEDKTNTGTVYQRVGRKPAIATVVANFITRVVGDARINGFFGAANAMRLQTCLVRQVCSIDGPCRYGKEVDGEPGVSATNVCKDMKSSHLGLSNPPGGAASSRGITKADFDALVEDLVKELDAAAVTAADKMAILGALGPLCGDIVAGGVGCVARTIIGLTTGNSLVMFDAASPMTVSAALPITGLQTGESIVGITIRPANGKLYGLGSSSRLYEVSQVTGIATVVGTATFALPLTGMNFGFDFNPTVDRIRLVSDQQQNLRLHPDTGVVVDGDAVTAGVQGDAMLSAPSVMAVAYTNSAAGATVTTLFGIDSATETLVRQGGPDGMPSPNAGVITAVGPLGVDASAPVGFDILAAGNVGYAAMQVGGASRLYMVNLTTGAATLVGPLGGGAAIRAIAIVGP